MNSKNRLLAKTGFTGALAAVLAGCSVTYQDSYVPPPVAPAAPAVAYAPPPPPPPQAPDNVVVIQSPSDFYEPLSPYGQWVVVGSYGRCWQPAQVDAGWRPYCNGYWQRTDAGWFWVSNEPWAWATYHYGRWDWNGNLGWIWVPQTQWAPSWVAWREGAGYVGWAPLPPTATIAVSGGVVFRDAAYAPRGFVFVQERNFCEPVRPTTVIVNNTTVINQTVNITKIQVVNQTVINDGPRPDVVERAGGRRVQTVAVRDLRYKEETPVMAQHPALRRNVRPVSTAETSVPPIVHNESQPARDALPHQTPPTEKTAGPTPEPAAPATLDAERSAHKEKAPKAGTETEPAAAARKPAPASNQSLASSSRETTHDHSGSKANDKDKDKDKDEKEKKGENPEPR